MGNISPLRGMATVSYWAEDQTKAVEWYTTFLNTKPYFNKPGYNEFRIGDSQAELGIIDAKYGSEVGNSHKAGSIVYWHVDDLDAVSRRLINMKAKVHQPKTDRGQGFVTASFVDPFGNILGIMYNPHYLEMLNKVKK